MMVGGQWEGARLITVVATVNLPHRRSLVEKASGYIYRSERAMNAQRLRGYTLLHLLAAIPLTLVVGTIAAQITDRVLRSQSAATSAKWQTT